MGETFVHPYIPNSVPEIKKALMREIGIKDTEALFADLPVRSELFELPGPMTEYELRRHIEGILSRNHEHMLVFCGAGCWPHYVPAVVDEIINRTEFKTAYLGLPEPEKGKMQALFEYQSLIAELIDMDVVINSVYDWAAAAAEAANMARRLTGRNQILVPANISPDRLGVIKMYTEWSGARLVSASFDSKSGTLDLEDLEQKITPDTAALYVENPTYLGIIEDQVDDLARMAQGAGALFIIGVDASSLGILRSPGDCGADIVVGEAQPLGLHMNFGGNFLGIFGCKDDPEYLEQLPGYVGAVAPTVDGKGRGYLDTLWDRRHFFHQRENATSLIGSSSNLCAIGAAVYMSLLGPQGMRDLGETITRKANYAIKRIGQIDGIEVPVFSGSHFKEFVVNFDALKTEVSAVNKTLFRDYAIVGGKDLSKEYPELGRSGLYCVTEAHTLDDIERLITALSEIAKRRSL
ncbi:MAG: aminomethyl-transferring glycine dehydrogenase subunit GcvPA [Desulfobacteraceae bacterium]|jgi:glycine dehydrogenase subunit 1